MFIRNDSQPQEDFGFQIENHQKIQDIEEINNQNQYNYEEEEEKERFSNLQQNHINNIQREMA